MDSNVSRNNSDAGIWIAIGLALGMGICIVFILHNISISIQMKNQQTQPQTAETGVKYVYDEQNRLQSIIPVTLKPL